MARGEPAPRPAEHAKLEALPGQETRLMAFVSTQEGRHAFTLATCSSPLATATEFYHSRPDLQASIYCLEIAQEALQLVELQADGTRIEHWVRLGQSTQVFINCDLMNAREVALYLEADPELDPNFVYAVPFGGSTYHVFHGNTDMLYDPLVDPDYERKQAQRKRFEAPAKVAATA